ncbi:hypothetical protein IHE44_0007862, partial [Lamprotornis superbus]
MTMSHPRKSQEGDTWSLGGPNLLQSQQLDKDTLAGLPQILTGTCPSWQIEEPWPLPPNPLCWCRGRYLAKLSSVGSISEEETCEKLKGLIQRQVQMCKRNLEVMDSVRRGAQLAIEECQYQFRNRRWNCSTLDTLPVFGKVVTQGTREAAFVYAISSAGVAFAVTRACSSGELDKCGCDRTVQGGSPQGFQWSGCSDNIAYGVAFSQSFVDIRERSKGASSNRALMNLHNNEAGRKAILNNMRVECKCHGAIDGCELMCCGRGFHTDEVEVVERCSCKFHWCCSVKCKPCHRVVEIHTC